MIRKLIPTLILAFVAMVSANATVVQISDDSIFNALSKLDNLIDHRGMYIAQRQNQIDSLKERLRNSRTEQDRLSNITAIAKSYTSFNNDSALYYCDLGMQLAPPELQIQFKLHHASLLPLAGMNERAIAECESIDPDQLTVDMRRLYFDRARQMYSYISSFHSDNPELSSLYDSLATESQRHLIEILQKETPQYKLNMGEYFHRTGENAKAKAVLEGLITSEPANSNIRARAAHIMSVISRDEGQNRNWFYYLIMSVMSDVYSATLEVVSLQDLGLTLYEQGDVDRAYNYLSVALENAVACHASTRMIQSAKALPVIERAYNSKISAWRTRIYWVICILAVLSVLLVAALLVVRRDMKRLRLLQERLTKANHIKEIYISRFLSLCSIYMDKLNQLCKIVERKITSGNVDELLRMTKSGKFVEEQSRAFYDVFDDAFLHIYPTFVAEVNALLQPDQQIVLKQGEKLNTDLRILAFMRLGIEDSSRISQVLNYSLNTIYTYRNKLKNKAINRETFEQDVINIGRNLQQ